MSNIKLQGNASGAGHLTIAAPVAATDKTITLPDATDTLAGQLNLGLRNRIINGNPLVNQRGAASASTAYADGAYFLDRWKAGAGGATLSFATSNNVVTITITAGSIIQVVEGLSLASGTHTLSWSGTAQGKIGAGSYSASGVTGSITGGTNTNVEFNTGTVSLVQLEPGSVATPFEHRPYGVELALCQRYYRTRRHHLVGSGYTAGAYVGQRIMLDPPMRTAPTVGTATGATASNFSGPSTNNVTADGFTLFGTATAAGALVEYIAEIPLSAEL